jgi:hypothetical protein
MTLEIAPKETESFLTFYDAKFYILFLDIDDKKGWRLPTLKELNGLNMYGAYWCAEDEGHLEKWPENKKWKVRAVRDIIT